MGGVAAWGNKCILHVIPVSGWNLLRGGGLMRFFRIGDLPRPQILCASYKEEGEKGPREDASETIG